jgi:hypothetical protein
MKTKCLLLSLIVSLAAFSFGQSEDSASSRQDLSALNTQPEPPMLGIHWARGFNPFARVAERAGSNPNMTYHGGVILPSVVSEAIYLGTELVQFNLCR